MKQLFSRILERIYNEDDGIAVPFIALSILGIILVCGVAVDGGQLFLTESRLQRTVDGAAIKGVHLLAEKDRQTVEDDVRTHISETLRAIGIDHLNPEPSAVVTASRVEAQVSVVVKTHLLALIPALAEITVSAKSAAERPRLMIALVLDRSDSMAGEKIAALREATLDFLELVDLQNDLLSIVAYDYDAEIIQPLGYLENEQARSNLQALIAGNALLPGLTGTCIGCGLKAAIDQFLNFGQSDNFFEVIILMTDGRPTRAADNTCGYSTNAVQYSSWPYYWNEPHGPPFKAANMYSLSQANRAKVNGITLHTVGLGKSTTYCDTPDAFSDDNCFCQSPASSPWEWYFDEDYDLESDVDDNPIGAWKNCFDGTFRFHEGGINSIFLAEVSNDPLALYEELGFEPLESEASIISLDRCDQEAPNSEHWEGIYADCGCHRRIGSNYPEGKYWETPEPEMLSTAFEALLQDARIKAIRFVE